jgi:hypothetical protein
MSVMAVPTTERRQPLAPRRPTVKRRKPRLSDGRRHPVTIRKVGE